MQHYHVRHQITQPQSIHVAAPITSKNRGMGQRRQMISARMAACSASTEAKATAIQKSVFQRECREEPFCGGIA